ncbi:hypothetical protein HDU76_009179 [Blyttiomyces sp. JEL0837]|nr:hypothetical protein HDU76_009179 [Blyttiomyces sp. JEL0837]
MADNNPPDRNFWDNVPDQSKPDSTKMTIDAAAFMKLVQDFGTFKSWYQQQEVENEVLKGEVKVLKGEVEYWKQKSENQEVVVQRLQERVVVLEGLSLKGVVEVGGGGFGGGEKIGGFDFDIDVESGSGSGDSTVRGSTSLAPEGGGFDGVLGSEKVENMFQQQEMSLPLGQSYPQTQPEQHLPGSSVLGTSASSYSREVTGAFMNEYVDAQDQQQQQQQEEFTLGSNYVNAPPTSHMTSTTPSSLVSKNDRGFDYSQTTTAAQSYSEPFASSSTRTIPPPPPTTTNNNNYNYDNTAAETTAEAFWDSFSPSSDLSVLQPGPMTTESNNDHE